MSTVAFDAFLPAVSPFVDGAPSLVIIDALRKAANSFCMESMAWAVTNDPQSVTAEQETYDIDSPQGTVVAALLSVSFNGLPLEAKTPEQLDRLLPNWSSQQGTPAYYYRPSDSEVRLVPMPAEDADDILVMRVAVAPDPLNGTGVDQDLSNKYHEAFAAGALARLYMLPGKWSNPQLAQFYGKLFATRRDDARAVAYVANSSAQLRVRGRRFV
jgi:hypothetical protein